MNKTVVQEMKILVAIFLWFIECHLYAAEPVATSLLSKIVAASNKDSTMIIGSGETTREITFRNSEENRLHPVEPVIFLISKVIERNYFPDLREVDLISARDGYSKYHDAIKKLDENPELHLWLSKSTDEELLLKFLTTVCPKGASSVWIRYFEPEHPIRIIPPTVNKPIPPENQKNPAQQVAPSNR